MNVYYCDRCGSATLQPKLFLTTYLCVNCYNEAWERYKEFLKEKHNGS